MRRLRVLAVSVMSVLVTILLVTSCAASPQQKVDALPLKEFLVTTQELPQGFVATPLTPQEQASAAEGTLAPTSPTCSEPSKLWAAQSRERAGQYLEYPTEDIVIVLLLLRGSGTLQQVSDYREHCARSVRRGPGMTVSVVTTPYDGNVPSQQAEASVLGYRDTLTVGPKKDVVSSTYLYGQLRGVSVIAILRSKRAVPTTVQEESLTAIFQGQLQKIHLTR